MSHWSQFFALGDKKSEVEMAALTENDPRIIEAYQEFQRFNADPATRELARQRQMFLLDYNWGMSASKKEGRAEVEAEWQADKMKWQAERQANEMKRIAKARELKRRGVDYETIMIATELSIDEIKCLE
jgi:hypothetical protein